MVKNQKILELLQAYKYDEAEKALKENIREELQKAAGTKKSDISIIKNIVKLAGKTYNKTLVKCHPFTVSGVNYYGFTDGHYVLASDNNFNYDIAEDHERLKMEKFFDVDTAGSMQLDIKEIEIFCKDNQNKIKYYQYTVKAPEGFYISFNAKYMLDCLKFCDTETIFYNNFNVSGCLKSPIKIENEKENKIALCLPVNCICKDAACTAYEYMEKWRKNEL